jgi:hypothetical protein
VVFAALQHAQIGIFFCQSLMQVLKPRAFQRKQKTTRLFLARLCFLE